MEFKRIQNQFSRQITAYYADGKKVTEAVYNHLQKEASAKGGKYNSSLTTRQGKNFVHTHHIS